ncbi:protein rolling stone-like [Lytechinus pictus]|uniref:protein rolling stone-like n=1 Tax=Lytechinus pictus TaxID=7653 RepID=UPI00240DCC10|nr:protein rolling stone-like [Lytechinus pictus]
MEAVIKVFAAKKFPVKKSWFGLKHENPKVFYKPQWRLPVWFFLSYRIFSTCYVISYFIYDLVCGIAKNGSRHFIYLSTWENFAFDCYFAVATANLIVSLRKDHLERLKQEQERKKQGIFQRFIKKFKKKPKETIAEKKDEEDETPLSYKIQWFLFNTTVPMSILVTIIYWTTLYMTPNDPDLINKAKVHAITMLLSFTELFITATPVRFWHFIYPIAFDLIFDFFSVIYWACGGTNAEGEPYIWPFLDYGNEPGTAGGVSLGMILSLLVLQGIMYGFYRLRCWLASKCGMNPDLDLVGNEKDGLVQGLVESPC